MNEFRVIRAEGEWVVLRKPCGAMFRVSAERAERWLEEVTAGAGRRASDTEMDILHDRPDSVVPLVAVREVEAMIVRCATMGLCICESCVRFALCSAILQFCA